MNADITVVCSAWHKQKDLELFYGQHRRSLINQTIPVKVIYVADGGLDLPNDHPMVEVVRVPRGITTAQAFNVALALTETEFFCALNLDDYFFTDALEFQVGALKERGADVVFGDWEIRFTKEADTDRTSGFLEDYTPCKNWPPEEAPRLRLGSGDRTRGTWGPAPVFRTQAVREACGYARQFGDGTPVRTIIDYILWQRLLRLGKQVMAAGRVFGTYYSSPSTQQEFRGDGPDPVGREHQLFDQHGALV